MFCWESLIFECGFVVIVELSGLVVVDTVTVGCPYPYIHFRSFEDVDDGIVGQFGVIPVILPERVAVIFVESRFRPYPQKSPAISEMLLTLLLDSPSVVESCLNITAGGISAGFPQAVKAKDSWHIKNKTDASCVFCNI